MASQSTLLHLAVQLSNQQRFKVSERLDGSDYTLTLYTVVKPPGYASNPAVRSGGWALDVFDNQGVALARGLRLCGGVDLLFPFRAYVNCPAGKLFVHTSDGTDPDLLAFAEKRARLYYQPSAEVTASGGST